MQFRDTAYRFVQKGHAPTVSVVIALSITFWLCLLSVQQEKLEGRQKFRSISEKFRAELATEIQSYLDTLPTLKAFAVLEPHPSDARIDRFISAVALSNRFPNLAFIFFSDHVNGADRDTYIQTRQHDTSLVPEGRSQFTIFPEGRRSEYLVIRYVSPDISETIGYDLFDPTQKYRSDVDRAVRENMPVATGPIVLARDRMKVRDFDNTSVVVRAPVFSDNQLPPAKEERAARFQSVVGIAFTTKKLIESVMGSEVGKRLHVRITDAELPASALPLYDNLPLEPIATGALEVDRFLTLPVEVANRRWNLTVVDRIPALSYWPRPIPIIIFAAGAAISALLWFLTRALVTRTEIAEAAVREALVQVKNEQLALEEAQAIAAVGSFEWCVATKRLSWSTQMERLYGCTAQTFCSDPGALYAQIPSPECNDVRQAIDSVRHAHAPLALEHMLVQENGDTLVIQIRSKWHFDADGNPRTLSGTAQEVTTLRKNEAEIVRLVVTDPLTGLPNRRYMTDCVSRTMDDAKRAGVFHALLFLDLDNFKIVNDTKGHTVGDRLLCMVGDRIRNVVPDRDTVGRIGGDEFVILVLANVETLDAATTVALAAAERVRGIFSSPFLIDGHQHMSGVSIGISVFPSTAETYADVFREADTAMYRSKETGRNRVTIFAESMQTEIEKRTAFELELAHAIRSQQLYLVAQTQFDVHRRPCGAELLLRWTRHDGENIPPDRFIPVAEETGLIISLGAWVFEQGCHTLLALDAAGYNDTVSINVSPKQFREPDFVTFVRDTLERLRVPAERLIFEVTEGLLIENIAETAGRMHEIRALGVRFSIDDFGTGYSSLAYLRDLPLYELKIDKSFIHAALTNTNDAAIVRLILGIAAQLNLQVVAEGVETEEQQHFLSQSGCDLMQGFLFARPQEIGTWLKKRIA